MLEDDHTQDIYKQSLVGQILTISERVVTLRGDDPVLQLSSVCSFSVSNSLWSVLLHGIKILWEKVNFLNHIFYKLQLSSSQSCEVHVTARKGVLDSDLQIKNQSTFNNTMCSQMMHFHLILIALPKEVDWGSHPMIWFSYGFSIDKTHSLLLLLRNKSLWRFSIESRLKIISNFSLSIKCIFFFCFYQSTIPFLPCHSVCRLGNWVGLCKTTSLVERLCSSRPHPKIRYMIRN